MLETIFLCSGTSKTGIYEHYHSHPQGAEPDKAESCGTVLHRGKTGICFSGYCQSGRYRDKLIALTSSYLACERKCPTDEIVIVMPCGSYTESGYFGTIK